AKDRIAAETGYQNIEVRLTNAAVISVRIDGQTVSNPIGFRGRHFTLTLFSAFAPLMQLGALETVAQGLDLTLVTIVAEPYALARCLSTNAGADSAARLAPKARKFPLDGATTVCSSANYTDGRAGNGGQHRRSRGAAKKRTRHHAHGSGLPGY